MKESPTKGRFNFPEDLELTSVDGTTLGISEEDTKFLNVGHTTAISNNPVQLGVDFKTRLQVARTLSGNDDEWRYAILNNNFLWIKQGLTALRWSARAVSPNTILTNLKHAFEAYLTSILMHGGLAGANSREVFSVKATGPNSSPENAGEQHICTKISLNMELEDSAPVSTRTINLKVFSHKYLSTM